MSKKEQAVEGEFGEEAPKSGPRMEEDIQVNRKRAALGENRKKTIENNYNYNQKK